MLNTDYYLQDVEGEDYLGIQLLRFYFRCAACAAEFILKTDPANTDYTMEKGATRNYEPWREKEKTVAQAVADREEEERGNAMKVDFTPMQTADCEVTFVMFQYPVVHLTTATDGKGSGRDRRKG